MSKIISFCLWSDLLKYNIGAIRNADLAREIYPGWISRFYCGNSVPEDTRIALLQHGNGWKEIEYVRDVARPYRKWASKDGLTELICYADPGDWHMMLDRFTAMRNCLSDDIECAIFRDCDSRLSNREKEAVDEWLASDKNFHRMFDHPWHLGVPVLGGMWGIKKDLFASEMSEWAMEWATTHASEWQVDQRFLQEVIWPLVKDSCMTHDPFFGNGIPFPSLRKDLEFVGQVFDENEVTVAEHQEVLRRWLKGRGEVVRIPKDLL